MDETGDTEPGRRASKPASAFRTIGEAADELDLPPHVLRFWESKFPQLQPLKRGGGRRYYRPEDLALLRRIRQCLYQEGYTIRGVQKLLSGAENGGGARRAARDHPAAPSLFPLDSYPAPPAADADAPAPPPPARRLASEIKQALAEIRRELVEARTLLEQLVGPGKRL